MSNTRYGLSALALAGMMGTAVLAQTGDGQSSGAKAQPANQADQSKQQQPRQQQPRQQQSSQQSQSQQQQQPQQQAPEGWVLIQERVVVLTANEPQNHFLRAQEHLAGGRAKEAAAEARIGAEYLGMQAARAAGGADQKLSAAADTLRQQAEQIARATGDAQQLQKQHGQQLSESFARANAALASHFQSLAKRDLQNQRNIMAGHDLEAASESLAAAFAWSGKQPQQDALTAIRDAQQAAAQLMTPGAGAGGAAAQGQGGQAGEAQTAGARIDEKGAQAPANVSQVLDKLGNAIQQSAGSFQQDPSGSGSSSEQSKPQQQQQGQQQTGQPNQPAR